MSAAKIKKGDKVVVLSGKDKGRTGNVVKVLPKDGKLVVEGVNIAARHRKPTQLNPQGGIERSEAPLHISKVAIADPKDGKPTRVGFKTMTDGRKRALRFVFFAASALATFTTDVITRAWIAMLQILTAAPTNSCRNMGIPRKIASRWANIASIFEARQSDR